MHAASALILNSVKHLTNIPKAVDLIPINVIDSITSLKTNILNRKQISLDLDETMIALSISAVLNPSAQMAVEKLKELSGCEVHLTHMPTPGDEAGLRKLGMNITSDSNFSSRRLFVK